MDQHIKLEHKYNQLYSCNICGEFKSGSLFDISTHKWIVHQDWTFEAKTASPEKVTIKSEKDIKQEPKTSETKDEIVQSATIKVAMEIKEELPDDSIDLEEQNGHNDAINLELGQNDTIDSEEPIQKENVVFKLDEDIDLKDPLAI